MAYDPEAWHDFYVMIGGAAAALTGLVFVALSIHRRAIVSSEFMLVRASYLTAGLTAIPLTAAFLLVPGQSRYVLGPELIASVFAFWALFYVPIVRIRRAAPGAIERQVLVRIVLAAASSCLWIAAGVSLMAHAGGGLYLLFPGVLIALVVNVSGAWSVLMRTDSD